MNPNFCDPPFYAFEGERKNGCEYCDTKDVAPYRVDEGEDDFRFRWACAECAAEMNFGEEACPPRPSGRW